MNPINAEKLPEIRKIAPATNLVFSNNQECRTGSISVPPDDKFPGKIVDAGFFDEQWKFTTERPK